jgi:AraC-like DNA-binding protein
MPKSWSASPKKLCIKCKTVWDREWTDSGYCPFCHAGKQKQHTLKASKTRSRKYTPEMMLQKRISDAESRLSELNCLRQQHENTPLSVEGVSRSNGWNDTLVTGKSRHMRDLAMLQYYQDEIVRTVGYITELRHELKNKYVQKSKNTVYSMQEGALCVLAQ